jgi:hypothetical protein
MKNDASVLAEIDATFGTVDRPEHYTLLTTHIAMSARSAMTCCEVRTETRFPCTM